MHYQRICKMLDITLTPEQDWACAWLEWHGQRFCVDFGYENCVDKADDILPMHIGRVGRC